MILIVDRAGGVASVTDGAVALCGEPCGFLGTNPEALGASTGRPEGARIGAWPCVDKPWRVKPLPTRPDEALSTIHSPTTTTKEK